MTIRLRGLVPAFALLAPACAVLTMGVAHAQQPYNPNAGQMSYPQSLPSGQVNIPASTARDTGNMAYPASPGGVTESAPRGRDTGNMAYPSGGGAVPRTTAAAAPMAPMGKAPPMRPDVAPTPAADRGRPLAGHGAELSPGAVHRLPAPGEADGGEAHDAQAHADA